jgi:uncharacterized repeat protein (TIGR02543 family)
MLKSKVLACLIVGFMMSSVGFASACQSDKSVVSDDQVSAQAQSDDAITPSVKEDLSENISQLADEYKDKIDNISSSVDELQQSVKALFVSFNSQADALTALRSQTQADIADLKAQLSNDIATVQNNLDKQSSALNELKADYSASIASLQADIASNKGEISALNAKYVTDIAALKDADGTLSTTLNDIIDNLNTNVAALKAAIISCEDGIKQLKADYLKDIATLTAADEDILKGIDELTQGYDSKIETINSAIEAMNEKLAKLEKDYVDNIASLNKSDEALGDKINDITKQYEDKTAQIDEAISAANDEVAALKADYLKDIAELTKVDGSLLESIAQLKDGVDESVAALDDKIKTSNKSIEDLTDNFNKQIAALKSDDETINTALSDLTKAYKDKVAALESADSQNATDINDLKVDFLLAVAQQSSDSQQAESAISKLREEYQAKMDELEAADKATDDALAAAQSDYTAKIDEVKGQIDDILSDISTVRSDIADGNKQYDERLTALADELATLNSAIQSNASDITAIYKVLDDLNIGKKHTVTFNSDGGQEVASQSVVHGEKATIPDEPTKDGYIFDGWFVGDEKWVFSGFAVTGDITLTAKWHKDTADITFVSAGQSTVVTYKLGDIVELTKPTEDGAIFVGWYLNGYKLDGTYVAESDVTITAKWQTYGIAAVADGITVDDELYIQTQDDYIKLNGMITADDNCSWRLYEDEECSVEYPMQTIYNLEYGANKAYILVEYNANYYTLYELNVYRYRTYTYTFKDGDETIATGSVTDKNPEIDTCSIVPEKEGYKFIGWGVSFPYSVDKDTVFTAQYEAVEYNITYILNGGQGNSNGTYTIEDSLVLAEPTRQYYTFDGWYESQDLSGQKVEQIPQGSMGDKTYYAKWVLREYAITYVLDGGSLICDDVIAKFTVEDLPLKLSDIIVEKDGAIFEGWTVDDEDIAEIAEAGDITLTAKYKYSSSGLSLTKSQDGTYYIITGYTGRVTR